MANRNWSRDELLVAYGLYCRLPFGQCHGKNKDIILLSKQIDRSPNAIAMKLCNFASFDPIHQARGVKGLANSGKGDKEIFQAFNDNWTALALESQHALERLGVTDNSFTEETPQPKETESQRLVKVRKVQGFFRHAVMASYDFTCAVCQINIPALVQASHIIPWSANEARRADPHNGIALCTLHDRAFDRGYLTFDEDHRIVTSKHLEGDSEVSNIHRITLLDIQGQPMHQPNRFGPDPIALDYHRQNIFVA